MFIVCILPRCYTEPTWMLECNVLTAALMCGLLGMRALLTIEDEGGLGHGGVDLLEVQLLELIPLCNTHTTGSQCDWIKQHVIWLLC